MRVSGSLGRGIRDLRDELLLVDLAVLLQCRYIRHLEIKGSTESKCYSFNTSILPALSMETCKPKTKD